MEAFSLILELTLFAQTVMHLARPAQEGLPTLTAIVVTLVGDSRIIIPWREHAPSLAQPNLIYQI